MLPFGPMGPYIVVHTSSPSGHHPSQPCLWRGGRERGREKAEKPFPHPRKIPRDCFKKEREEKKLKVILKTRIGFHPIFTHAHTHSYEADSSDGSEVITTKKGL